MKKILLIVLIQMACWPVIGQPDLDFKRAKASYPEENVVILKETDHYMIDLIEGKPSVKNEKYVEYIYLDNLASTFSSHSIDYSILYNLTSIDAGTLSPKKSKYSETKVKDFTYDNKISNSVFFDGGKTVSFLFPYLSPGSKSWLKYTKELTEPRLMPAFYPQRGVPVKESEFSITASNEIELDWKLFNLEDSLYTFVKTVLKNDKTNYRWTLKNVPKYRYEENAPGASYYTPHIITWIKSYKKEGKTHKVFGTPADLYSWYYSLVKDVNNVHSKEIMNAVDSLVAGESNELDKVRKIFYWVQDNVKYVAFEDGMGGFIPRSPESVCHKRYGDCKDMASLIHNMLSYAKIPSHLTWIGSRRIPYTYKDVPTPAVDDHMIATYIHDGKHYFLDATGQYIPFGWPTSFIQGKEALIAIDSINFEIVKVPEISSDKSVMKDSVTLSIEGEKLIGKGVSILSGYEKIQMNYTLSGSEKELNKILREYYSKGNNKFLISTYDVKNLYEKDKPLEIKYDFTIEDYMNRHDQEMYINLHLNKDLQKEGLSKDRVLPLEKDFNSTKDYVVTLLIPNGYKASYLPENRNYKSNGFGYSISYSRKGKYIIMKEKFYCDRLLLEKEDFEQWNTMIQEIKKDYSEVLILQKI